MSWLKDYFSFSRKERNAFIILLLIIAGFIYLPNLFSPKKTTVAISPQLQKETVNRSSGKERSNENEGWQTPFSAPEQKRKPKLFTFDPNTLDEDGFITLGLPERTARTIINYRNKGGKFRKPDDLRKIYSLKKEDADRIIPYARIETTNNYYTPNKYQSYNREEYSPKNKTVTPIDINTATVEEWKSLPGIGDVLSERIVKYRNRIKGFTSIEEVAKTYGLKDSTFQVIKSYLKIVTPAEKKININTAYVHELIECPAINRDIALAILAYRQTNKKFNSLEDLKKIEIITNQSYEEIVACVTIH